MKSHKISIHSLFRQRCGCNSKLHLRQFILWKIVIQVIIVLKYASNRFILICISKFFLLGKGTVLGRGTAPNPKPIPTYDWLTACESTGMRWLINSCLFCLQNSWIHARIFDIWRMVQLQYFDFYITAKITKYLLLFRTFSEDSYRISDQEIISEKRRADPTR